MPSFLGGLPKGGRVTADDRYADYGLAPYRAELTLQRQRHNCESRLLHARIRPSIAYARKHGFTTSEIAFALGIEEEELRAIER